MPVSSSSLEVPCHVPGLSKSLPVPHHCWTEVCRDLGNNPKCFAWESVNGGVRNHIVKDSVQTQANLVSIV